MATKIDIYNNALVGWLGVDRIDSLGTGGKPKRVLDVAYPFIKLSTITAHDWHSASKRVSIDQADTDPAFGWERQFPVPADSLKVWHIVADNEPSRPFKEEGGFILTNAWSPLPVRYVYDVDETKMEPMLADCISVGLASRCCIKLTRDEGLQRRLAQTYADMLQDAKTSDSQTGTRDRSHQETIAGGRHTGLYAPHVSMPE